MVAEGSYAIKETNTFQMESDLLKIPGAMDLKTRSLNICSSLPRGGKKRLVSVTVEDESHDIVQEQSTGRKRSTISMLSQPSILEVDETGNSAYTYGVISEDGGF